ncbi:MAG: hypothetical protein MUF18_01675 [Fimbriiglobus sp.]|jgi:pimeloyl-ACP methyl ester carboxylesterase|nr:hypothetical protein [Fimbriiglobus sp.]
MLCRLALAGWLLTAPVALSQDAVVFPDGFTLRGKYGKEVASPAVLDSPLDLTFPADYLNAGDHWVYFSNNTKKKIQLIQGAIKDDKPLAFTRPATLGPSKLPTGIGTSTTTIGPFNADGRRQINITFSNSPGSRIVQVVSSITPKHLTLTAITHNLRQVHGLNDPGFGPAVVRELLANHPDLRDGWLPAPDPAKRLRIAELMLAAGWFVETRAELDRTKKEIPWAWPKEATEKYDQIAAAIDQAETNWVMGRLESAVAAGQYRTAADALATYQPKGADKLTLDRFSKLKATVETLQPKHEAARRHLRTMIDEVTGADRQHLAAAVGGPAIELSFPGKPVPAEWKGVIPGAEAVYAELHPDTLDRVETFAQVAAQMARERAAGRQPKAKTEEALALAVTGWLLGKNGAKTDPVYASRVWNTRAMITDYLNERASNARVTLLQKYQQSNDALGADEIAQLVTLLPPSDPEDLANRRGKLIDVKESGAPDVYQVDSGALPDDTDGVSYVIRLPREYQHGRTYPLLVALHDPALPPAGMVGNLAAEADRNGYILVAPEWLTRKKRFDYLGTDHRIVTSTVRDVSRRFAVDPDRVFAFGFGEGGNLALDLAMSRPDQFAGVVCMCGSPVHQFYRDYAKNAQKLAVYSVTGERASGMDGLRRLYQNWLPFGYYAVLSVYKGRSEEWYAGEVPTIFDWMNRKKRVRGLESLRMDGQRFDDWRTFRPTDDRFYWVGVSGLMEGNSLTSKRAARPDNPPFPATFSADIINGNTIVVKAGAGVKKVTVWLERGMIAWDTEVKFSVNAGVNQLKPTKVKPDLDVMMEELYRTGDRKMLFFAKFEFRVN